MDTLAFWVPGQSLIAPLFSNGPERIPGCLTPRMTNTGEEKMMDMIAQKRGPVTIGIDVSEAVPDVHLHPEGLRHRFANDSAGHAAWTGRAAPHQPERVIFEATGACHRALETACLMLNPAPEV